MKTILRKGLLLSAMAIISTAANAQSGTCGATDADNITWNYDAATTTLTFTGTGAIVDYTRSGNLPWNSYRGAITKVVIGEGITAIGQNNLYECKKVTSVSLPSTLTKIGTQAFKSNEAWTGALVLPEGVTTVGENAFSGCNALTSVTLPSTLQSAGTQAFYIKNRNTKVPYTFKSNPTLGNKCLYDGQYTATLALDDAEAPFFSATSANTFNGGVSYKRAVKDAAEAIVLPFAPDAVPDGCLVYELAEAADNQLVFKAVDAMEAGKPYLIVAEAGAELTFSATASTTIAANAKPAATTTGEWSMTGAYATETLAAYGFQSDKVVQTEELQVLPFRAYFTTTQEDAPAEMTVALGSTPSGINSAAVSSLSELQAVYAANGQRLPSLQKGLNIVRFTDGMVRKVILK